MSFLADIYLDKTKQIIIYVHPLENRKGYYSHVSLPEISTLSDEDRTKYIEEYVKSMTKISNISIKKFGSRIYFFIFSKLEEQLILLIQEDNEGNLYLLNPINSEDELEICSQNYLLQKIMLYPPKHVNDNVICTCNYIQVNSDKKSHQYHFPYVHDYSKEICEHNFDQIIELRDQNRFRPENFITKLINCPELRDLHGISKKHKRFIKGLIEDYHVFYTDKSLDIDFFLSIRNEMHKKPIYRNLELDTQIILRMSNMYELRKICRTNYYLKEIVNTLHFNVKYFKRYYFYKIQNVLSEYAEFLSTNKDTISSKSILFNGDLITKKSILSDGDLITKKSILTSKMIVSDKYVPRRYSEERIEKFKTFYRPESYRFENPDELNHYDNLFNILEIINIFMDGRKFHLIRKLRKKWRSDILSKCIKHGYRNLFVYLVLLNLSRQRFNPNFLENPDIHFQDNNLLDNSPHLTDGIFSKNEMHSIMRFGDINLINFLLTKYPSKFHLYIVHGNFISNDILSSANYETLKFVHEKTNHFWTEYLYDQVTARDDVERFEFLYRRVHVNLEILYRHVNILRMSPKIVEFLHSENIIFDDNFCRRFYLACLLKGGILEDFDGENRNCELIERLYHNHLVIDKEFLLAVISKGRINLIKKLFTNVTKIIIDNVEMIEVIINRNFLFIDHTDCERRSCEIQNVKITLTVSDIINTIFYAEMTLLNIEAYDYFLNELELYKYCDFKLIQQIINSQDFFAIKYFFTNPIFKEIIENESKISPILSVTVSSETNQLIRNADFREIVHILNIYFPTIQYIKI